MIAYSYSIYTKSYLKLIIDETYVRHHSASYRMLMFFTKLIKSGSNRWCLGLVFAFECRRLKAFDFTEYLFCIFSVFVYLGCIGIGCA